MHRFPDRPQSGSLNHHVSTSPPLRSRKVGLPESGSDLGATPRSSSWKERGLSADPHAPQLRPVYFQGRSVVHRPWVLLVRLLLKPPSAQSPFARSRCYLSRRGCWLHVSGRYPAVIAPTGSCASPTPSHRLRSQPWSAGLRRSLSAPAGRIGPSQRYLHESFPRCLDPYPGGPHGARTRFFP